MNLEDLRERRQREREQDSLGRLPESFYRDAAEYVAELKRARERAAERADDPYGDPEVRRLTDELDAATEVVESLYERRVGKVVKHASFAAADMPHDDEGLTDEERALFDDLVGRLRDSRSRVLGALAESGGVDTADVATDGDEATPDADAADPSPARPDTGGDDTGPPPTPDDPAGMLAEAMGGEPSNDPRVDGGEAAERSEAKRRPHDTDEEADPGPTGGRGERDGPAVGDGDPDPDGAAAPESDGPAERTTVRITADVGEIYGVDDRSYRLEAEDVVSLPADNATPLVEKGAAERL